MSWARKSLAELGTWYGGSTPSKAEVDYWDGGDIPWLSPKDMGDEQLLGTQDHVTRFAVERGRARMVPPDSVAVVVRSGILERKVPIAHVPFATTLNQDMKALSVGPGVLPRWVAWALRSQEGEILAEDRKSGTTVASLDSAKFMSRTIPLPTEDEQRRIVDLLEDHLSRLDAANGYTRAAAARMEPLTAALASKAISGADRRLSLGALKTKSGYGTSAKCTYDGAGTPVLRIPNVQGGRLDLQDVKFLEDESVDVSALMVRAGDLLIVRTNGSRSLIGRAAVVSQGVEAAFASYLIRYRLDSNVVLSEWVNLVLASPQGRAYLEAMAASSAGQYNLSVSKLDGFPVPLPELADQRRLLQELEPAVDEAARLAAVLDAAHTRSASLRRALLAAAFSGQLTGRASDSDRIEELADASHDPR